MPMTRRRFLADGLVAGSAWLSGRGLGAGDTVVDVSSKSGLAPVRIADDFIGLGYEMSSVAQPGLLSAANRPYVTLVRQLGARGVLRLGGIVRDFTRYEPEGSVRTLPKDTILTRASLVELRGFLDATGWSALWSLNFGSGTLNDALLEAKDVVRILGPRIAAFELGNEVENYSRGAHPLRTPPYGYETFRREYSAWRDALLAAEPGVRFAAPDTAASVEWVERMAADARGDVQLLTTHYYRGDQKLGTREQLARPDAELAAKLEKLRRASEASGIPWRMCEMNSFFGGGRPGLSDTLLGALWTLDVLLLLASSGCAGVNVETGVNQLGFISSYSPIADDGRGSNSAGVPYYGMLAFAQATRDARWVRAIPCDSQDGSLTAYGLGDGQSGRGAVIVNRGDTARSVLLRGFGRRAKSLLWLTGLSPLSQVGITLGGSAVRADGSWSGAWSGGERGERIEVAAGSAVVVRGG